MSASTIPLENQSAVPATDVFSRLIEMAASLLGDRKRRRTEFVFTAGVIALAAKMAKADGIVLPSEIDAFLELCDIPEGEAANVSHLFNLAKQSVAGFEGYADQLGRYFGDTPDLLEDVLDGLFHIAKADQALHEDELVYLEAVAERFGIGARYPRILARHAYETSGDPHGVLGTHPEMDQEDIRKRYRELVAQHHPDRLIARGVPEAFLKLATEKLAAINVAYAQVQAEPEL